MTEREAAEAAYVEAANAASEAWAEFAYAKFDAPEGTPWEAYAPAVEAEWRAVAAQDFADAMFRAAYGD